MVVTLALFAAIIPGNAALQLGPIAVATVPGSLYPLATTAPANRSGREPNGRVNIAGILLAGLGAALIAVAG